MTELELLADLHKDGKRQGPGSDAVTKMALKLSGFTNKQKLSIADIGCGSGTQTIILAKNTTGNITAVDILPQFLTKLSQNVKELQINDRVKTSCQSMESLSFDRESFDLIWSEGAIYNMGFLKGIISWKPFLKTNGILAVSEISWFTYQRPKEIHDYWKTIYPEIDTLSAKIGILEENGYSPIACFKLPQECWTDEYYHPLKQRIPAFLERHKHSAEAKAIVENEMEEMAFYDRYNTYYGYGFFIAQKL